jgi:hypothetical protein
MVALNRVRVAWSNFPGSPGLSTFYLTGTTTNVGPLLTWANAIVPLVPTGLTLTVPNGGDVIDSGTNQITGAWTGSGGGTATSVAATGNYSGTSGALIRWTTGAVLNGRRLSGRTYIVPLNNNQYDNVGSLAGSTITALQTASNTMIASFASAMQIYGPPRDADPSIPGDLGKAAITSPALLAIVPDLAVVMRSRRV